MDSRGIVPGSPEDRDPTRFEEPEFPTLEEALSAVSGDADVVGLTPYTIQIGILASREVTYKIAVKETEDTVSGVLVV